MSKMITFKMSQEMYERMNVLSGHFQVERCKNKVFIGNYTREKLFMDLINFAYENKVEPKKRRIGFHNETTKPHDSY